MANAADVPKLYQSVVDDVINNVREAFLDDGVDEQVLLELKQLWESKLIQSKVLQPAKAVPQVVTLNPGVQHITHTIQAPQTTTQHHVPAFQAQMPVINPGQQHGLLEMSGAAQAATLALPAGLYQQQLAALQGGTITLTQGGTQYIIQANPNQLLQASQNAAGQSSAMPSTTDQQTVQRMVQLDGPNDSSSDDDDDDDDDGDKDDDDDDQNDEENEEQGEEEDPLNSGDDVLSEEDPTEVFDTENVVVCQFDRINRNKNKWKFNFKDGIMNLNGRDYVFQKATGEAEW